jgi:hypothetical protein
MRYVIAVTVLAFLAAAPVRAQQETGQQKTSAPTTTEQMADAEDDLDARIASDWSKIQSHWTMVESAKGADKAEHLEMHRALLGDFMKELDEHAKLEVGMEHPDEETEKMEKSLADAQKHWQVVQGIKEPEQLETHLGMHMEILTPLVAEEEDAGEHGMKHEGMEEGMEHGDMDKGKPGYNQPEPSPQPEQEKPAGY